MHICQSASSTIQFHRDQTPTPLNDLDNVADAEEERDFLRRQQDLPLKLWRTSSNIMPQPKTATRQPRLHLVSLANTHVAVAGPLRHNLVTLGLLLVLC